MAHLYDIKYRRRIIRWTAVPYMRSGLLTASARKNDSDLCGNRLLNLVFHGGTYFIGLAVRNLRVNAIISWPFWVLVWNLSLWKNTRQSYFYKLWWICYLIHLWNWISCHNISILFFYSTFYFVTIPVTQNTGKPKNYTKTSQVGNVSLSLTLF